MAVAERKSVADGFKVLLSMRKSVGPKRDCASGLEHARKCGST